MDESLRLMKMSKYSLTEEGGGRGGGRAKRAGDPISEVFSLLRDLSEQRGELEISYEDALACIARRAYGAHLLDQCLVEYEELGVWSIERGEDGLVVSLEFLPAAD